MTAKPSAEKFDAMCDLFTSYARTVANWQQYYYGAAYSTRLKAAIADMKFAIAEAEKHPEIVQPAQTGAYAVTLQARKPEGGDWINIYPVQLYHIAKGNDVRAIESSAPSAAQAGGGAVGGLIPDPNSASGYRLASPPSVPGVEREQIARIIDPQFCDPLALSLNEHRTEKALAKADAILAPIEQPAGKKL